MKTHTFKEQGIDWILISVPKAAVKFGYNMFNNAGQCFLEYYTEDKKCFKTDTIIDIDDKIIGCISKDDEIDFEVRREWVESRQSLINYYILYPDKENFINSLKDSFFSLLKSEISNGFEVRPEKLLLIKIGK